VKVSPLGAFAGHAPVVGLSSTLTLALRTA
jgi:hypothetical protein